MHYILAVEFLPHDALSFKPSRLWSLILIEIYYKKTSLYKTMYVLTFFESSFIVQFVVDCGPCLLNNVVLCACPSPVVQTSPFAVS